MTSFYTNIPNRRAPFTLDAWNSPEVLAKVSEVAGIELVPAMDYEIAAINISVNDQTVPIFNAPKTDEDEYPAFVWHRDSYPFVFVYIALQLRRHDWRRNRTEDRLG